MRDLITCFDQQFMEINYEMNDNEKITILWKDWKDWKDGQREMLQIITIDTNKERHTHTFI